MMSCRFSVCYVFQGVVRLFPRHNKCKIFRHVLQLCQNNRFNATLFPGLFANRAFFWRYPPLAS